MSDLEAIAAYISRDSPAYGDIVVRRIVAAVDRLRLFPHSGRVVPEVGSPDVREVIVRPYRVVYRLCQGATEIVTVVHASRHFRNLPGVPEVWERPSTVYGPGAGSTA